MNTITINRTIESDMLQIPELSKLIGKEVQINIIPITNKKSNNKNKNTKLGSYDLNGKFDDLNIRDFANEN